MMRNIRSKFKILPFFTAIGLIFFGFFLFYICLVSPVATIVLPVLFLLFVAYFWLTEFRTRAHKISVNTDFISVCKLFGLGRSEVYDFKKLDGFEISIQSGKSGSFEFLFVLKNGKRVACISNFYHSNYGELKKILLENLSYFGVKKYSFKEEYSQMLK
ncbi:hypothetical protein [Flavobacterium acetivorans]|uniref:hypothetical protein n=1 Tax=Flavobacterium acetivorans TaxID=2893883 RepID=UPI001E492809|nr:hypothetical protein [Flavobacterium sp. F-29]UFH34087.1 hypothetical protein LNP19_08235 [Flavobacterium sp. F-29]